MKIIKIILFLGILAAVAHFLYAPSPSCVPDQGKGKSRISKNISAQNKDYSALLAKIESSHVFTALMRQGTGNTLIANESFTKVVENFRLAGVMTSGGAKAIIEDKTSSHRPRT